MRDILERLDTWELHVTYVGVLIILLILQNQLH